MSEPGALSTMRSRAWTARGVSIVAAFALQVAGILALQSLVSGENRFGEPAHVAPIRVLNVSLSGPPDLSARLFEPSIEAPPIEIPGPELATLEFEGEAAVPDHSTPTRLIPPRLAEASEGTFDEYAQWVSLPRGNSARTIVLVEVLADGSAGAVEVEASSGSEVVDRVAIDYVKSLRWYSATMRGAPIAVRISMPVIFSSQP